MRPFLILGVAALFASWLIWPDHNSTVVVPTTTTVDAPLSSLATEATLLLPQAPIIQRSPVSNQLPATVAQAATDPSGAENQSGTVFGQILDSTGTPIPVGNVFVFERSKQIATAKICGEELQYCVELAANKYYEFMVDPSSLAGGFLPPLRQSRNSALRGNATDPNNPHNFVKSIVKVEAGLKQRLDLAVSLPAAVFGRVLDPQGKPLPGVQLRMNGMHQQQGIQAMDDLTNELGEFHITEIAPGDFRLSLYTNPETTPADGSWSPPSPQLVTLYAGQAYDFGDIHLGRGSHSILGSVVNQDGDPFVNRVILCYSNDPEQDGSTLHNMGAPLTRVTTDRNGNFEMKNIAATKIKILLTSDFLPGQAMGAGKPAMWEYPLEFDLSACPGVLDIGQHIVHESRPYEISGDLIFDPAWLALQGNQKSDLAMTLSPIEGVVLEPGIRRNPLQKQRVPLDFEEDTYLFRVETPLAKARLTFSLRGYPEISFVVRPEALQRKSRNLHIPSDFRK